MDGNGDLMADLWAVAYESVILDIISIIIDSGKVKERLSIYMNLYQIPRNRLKTIHNCAILYTEKIYKDSCT